MAVRILGRKMVLVTVAEGQALKAANLLVEPLDKSQHLLATRMATSLDPSQFTTFLLSLPSFFVVNTLLGLRADFGKVVRALLSTQAGLTIILSALAPYTAFWYVCGSRYEPAILFNGLMFVRWRAWKVPSGCYGRSHLPLVEEQSQCIAGCSRAWLVIYVFVGIQMGCRVLRPFIGDPTKPGAAVLSATEGWSNAYEVVIQMIWDVEWKREEGVVAVSEHPWNRSERTMTQNPHHAPPA